ncbi:WD40 repeat domain-containing protein, partial [Tumidithrix helvetica]|uniref:WD40 repeat domain-containing protein n=1 Tax=Tumidithrix helvetica TaxID=3457545 RepID=UPI003CC689E0
MDEEIASTATLNQNSLRLLKRVATNAQGFSLSIALCNYRSLQNRYLAELTAQLPDRAIATIELEPDATTLLTLVQDLMETVAHEPPERQPKVLMVLGLEEVKDVSAVLQSANRVREEFANCLDFPMVLWLNDRTQDILTRDASDLANWVTAGALEFRFTPAELVGFLRETTESLFARFLNPETDGMFRGGAIAKGLQKFELETAVKELQASGQVLNPELAANLDFAFGFCALLEKEFASAKQSFGKSLEVWRGRNALKQAACLFQVGVCDRTVAFHRRYDKVPFYRLARESFAEAIAIFRDLGRSDLVAEYLNFLMAVVEDLARLDRDLKRSPPAPLNKGGEFIRGKELFEELEGLAREALGLRQRYPNLLKEAHDRGMMAAVKIAFGEYVEAQQFAEGALALYREAERQQLPNLAWTRRYIYGLYEIWLARALAGQGKRAEAIAGLEGVRSQWRHQYDAQIYVGVLEELRSQYTQAGRYLDAFHTKQHQRSVEQQYGLRAFIGAGMLHPSREEVDPATAAIALRQPDGIAVEIVASGRKQNVEELVERIRQPRYPLTVIHGDSGAGKSSILNGGVVPALRSRETLDGRKVLVLTVNTYKEWSREIERQLQEFFGGARPELNPIEHFKRNVEENYLTVLVFDQFEDFFFKKEDFADRLPFYKFLRACLHTDFVRVVLSLREDYLHYLLECDRAVNLEKVENDILGKQIRYYLGDFTPEEARRVIESLTARAEVKLDADLCDRLVVDLTGDRGRVLPIELQVAGAQLESEEPQISTLAQYLALTSDVSQRKPSEVLVERWLENVVKDCGEGNQELAQRVLYALTGMEEKRPQKTQEELAAELLTSPPAPLLKGEGSKNESLLPLSHGERGLGGDVNLELVLAVLVGSGLAFRVSSTPEDRYQLIHDYLTGFIRKKYGIDVNAELRKERKRRELAELAREQAEKEKEIFAVANRKAGQRVRIGSIILGIASIAAIGISIYASKAFQASQEAIAITQIEKQSAEAERLFKTQEFQALLPAMRATKLLKAIVKDSMHTEQYPSVSPLGALQLILRDGQERLQFRATGIVFSPDGTKLATSGSDGTARIWDLQGNQIAILKGHQG